MDGGAGTSTVGGADDTAQLILVQLGLVVGGLQNIGLYEFQ